MATLSEQFQSADWKKEKHVPVIDTPEQVEKGVFFDIRVAIGREVGHPNKTEHHIRWIEVYFLPDGAKAPFQIGRAEFTAHGESTDGPDTSGVYTNHEAVFSFKTESPGMILASSLCNIHGLWQNESPLSLG